MRRFPAPWTVESLDGGFKIVDANGQTLTYVYGHAKHALAPYRSGRSSTWLKTKCSTQSTFVVIGTDHDRKTGALRALLALKDSAGLSYAGAAFISLAGNERAQFFAELERLATSWAAFKSSRLMDVKWCHPKLVVEVKHLAGSKLLRHATVKRLAT
jgi:bifunctional non-homologous end joining protein LigD